METPVSRSALYGKLAGPLFRSLESATAFCKLRSNPWVELTHWLHQLTQQPDNDILHVLRHYQLPLSDVEKALLRQLDMLPAGASAISDFSHHIDLSVEKAWMLASVRYGDNKIRSGWLLLALLTTPELRRVLSSICAPLPGCGRDRYGYNEWGELTTRRDQQLEWNAQGQLTRVISGNTETHYGYDALGRRIRKATYGRHTGHTARSRTDFVWEGFRLLQENVQQQGWRTYLYDAEQPYTPVASVTGKGESRQVWYYHTDVTGTPQEVTAADGTLVWAGYIRGFGENAADISNSGAYFHQPLRLPGQYFDDETGLHYNLFRYYAPECGRFVSQDPIGLRGGLNLYAYAPNPIRWIDPLGLAILEHQSNFDAARRTGFENAGMTNPEDVTFSKVDPKTGTVVEFKGPNGAKVAYDAPHADMDVTAGHDKPHVGWQSAGKRGSGGANRGNITYDGPQHPHRSDSKGDDKC
ncbi:polymorphic toxin type 47 domain-containing protein [Salmonella enterica subsp. enterica serovar Newport]|nr:hypothetical protein [Salmonella enterica subsp. enterica serovar Newport]EDT0435967.1 hypothetical protein [Salmonella enterica]EIT0296001.1 RHS domain-containing protein [Salmonella enterica]EJL3964902.1 RHS domain-containing protein [Salmonella enterica subsp. enterica serovar Newport]EKH9922441.1 RHS domain-containing protein [Salmonella enterica subsp. enterica serovar Newport]